MVETIQSDDGGKDQEIDNQNEEEDKVQDEIEEVNENR